MKFAVVAISALIIPLGAGSALAQKALENRSESAVEHASDKANEALSKDKAGKAKAKGKSAEDAEDGSAVKDKVTGGAKDKAKKAKKVK